ncbi:xaa-Pro aminopeptidase 1-like isoform X4 [Amphiura filiformis]|uniref:xaa-Pro aminopeptidase 1-like isoform X4 n=1 Tax=Amphiura filiformis TaxID=82378 RepID=UPI003B217FDC
MTTKKTGGLLSKLRELMKAKQVVGEPLQAYIVPSGDAHQSEYIAGCDNRRSFISGFTGSFGVAIITHNAAALWTDGRYYLQAASQMDENWTLMKHGMPNTPSQEDWLVKVLPESSRVGVDPFLFSIDSWKQFSGTLKTAGHDMVPVQPNLIDQVWAEERPAPPADEVFVQTMKYSGHSWPDKITLMRQKMKEKGAEYLVMTALDEVAWLYNLRGSDIDFNPVFFSYAVVGKDSTHLFIDENKLTEAAKAHLNTSDMRVHIHPYDEIQSFLSSVYTDGKKCGKTWLSPKSSFALASCIPQDQRILQITPACTSKAVKNPVEIEGMRNAHIRDAVALCEYFSWLEKEVPKGNITEISGADKLEGFRREQADFVSLSFTTISSVGSNGAIIHYSPKPETDRPINTQEIYLCDSGGQYRDGTTDVTRTMHFGTPTPHEKECFTRVLKGVISLASAIFPSGTKGILLDSFARQHLWQVGLDYVHGTGHGVGSFLNVHEGPQSISFRSGPPDTPITANIFLSDEPGYYEDGAFGIRTENVVVTVPAETKHHFKNQTFLTFETVTLVPIQLKMVEPSLLTESEISWINDYHVKCREIVGKELERQGRHEALKWLIKESQMLG